MTTIARGRLAKVIQFQASEAKLVEVAAQELGISCHAFMRSTILEKATEVLGEGDEESPNSDKNG